MTVRIIRGEVDSARVTTRTVLPTTVEPSWPPFDRVAETIATPRRPFRMHRHAGVEVLTYVVEGSANYQLEGGPSELLGSGALRLLTAPVSAAHSINPDPGRTVRTFAVVVGPVSGGAEGVRLQSATAEPAQVQSDGTATRSLIGIRTPITSVTGLACEDIEFRESSTSFRKLGHDRRAVVYSLGGAGEVDGHPIDAGEAALVEEAAGVALHAEPGTRMILSSAPRPAPRSGSPDASGRRPA